MPHSEIIVRLEVKRSSAFMLEFCNSYRGSRLLKSVNQLMEKRIFGIRVEKKVFIEKSLMNKRHSLENERVLRNTATCRFRSSIMTIFHSRARMACKET